jgi:AAA domain
VAGDHLQLAPILKGTYPKSDYALFGSILHCLLRDSNLLAPTATPNSSAPQMFFQLEENFRMNPQLCNFVEIIYQKRFEPMRSRREIALLGEDISLHLSRSPACSVSGLLQGMSEVMKSGRSEMMSAPISVVHSKGGNATTLFMMKLVPNLGHFSPAELHVRLEAKVVGELVRELVGAFPDETIFVVTPHRVQRSLVSKELSLHGIALRNREDNDSEEKARVWVDTTERMQGIISFVMV